MSDYIIFDAADKARLGDIAEGARVMGIRSLTRAEFDAWYGAILDLIPSFEGSPDSDVTPDPETKIHI
jgi:hypothetical protein